MEFKGDHRIFSGKFGEISWEIIESYFKNCHLQQLVRHQIESYNNFITYEIQRTIQMFNPLLVRCDPEEGSDTSIEINVNFSNFKMYRPQIFENNGSSKIMYPNEARLRNFTYNSQMTLDINVTYEIKNGDSTQTIMKSMPNINIGKIPIMLKSTLCSLKCAYGSNLSPEC